MIDPIAEPMRPTAPEDGTRARIVDVVEALMMQRGFNAISYQDVADLVGIRKASIHYHFPGKGDLGVAVIGRYIDKLHGGAPPVADLDPTAYPLALERFLAVFASVAENPGKVCLGGVLGAEFETLPDAMQREVGRFYATAQGWLAELLQAGRASGAFDFADDPEDLASAIVSMLEGALIMGRALRGKRQIAAALAAARRLAGN